MDEVHGGIFIRFAEVLVGLPMLSLFHIGSPCGERASFQTRILGSYKRRKLWGLRPQTPMKIIKIQTLPIVRVPQTIGREGKK